MKAYIILEDGHIFCGKRFGADGDAIGELVFTTGMGGYIETLTDPAYYGQIVMQTFPLIGNYGVIESDKESEKPFLTAYIIRDLCDAPSNFRCEKDLDTYLRENGIVGVYDVDTREITRIIRENGVMNAKIVSELPSEKPEELLSYNVCDAIKAVSCKESYTVDAIGEKRFSVGVLDLGVKKSTINELAKRGLEVKVLPYDTSADEMLKLDGIVLAGGPGNSEENTEVIENIKKIMGKKPVFGISLGHQLLALAAGGETEKMKHGHRGANHPVRDIENYRVFISRQNHGFAVKADSLPDCAKVNYVSANDGSCEGIEYAGKMAFSVQFSPETKGTGDLFDKFVKMLEEVNI